MSAVTGKNAVANLIGSLAGPLIGLVMTPFYLHQIGLEGLGLIGLMTLITTVLGVFIAGAGKTYQRDLSAAHISAPEDLRGLVRGGMLLFAALGLMMGLGVLVLGQGQIRDLAAGTHFTDEVMQRCLVIISSLLALGVTTGAFSSTLVSLKDQVWPNTLGIVLALLTATISWFCLSRWPRVDVFYFCQLGNGAVHATALGIRCRYILRRESTGILPRSMADAWRDKIRTSGRLSFILILHEGLGVVISQIDRLLVTSQFPLAALGIYNLGANPSRLVGIFTSPIATVTYPEFCRVATDGSGKTLIGEYLGRVTFLLVLLLGSAMIVLVPSARDLLVLWLGAEHVPVQAPVCLTLLSAAHLMLSIAGPSYNLTVAFGKVGYGIPKNIISILILPPLGFLLAKSWGLPGVAMVWAIYALICVGVCGTVAYRRHANMAGGRRWLIGDIASLSCAGLIAFALVKTPLEGLAMIAASITCSALFTIFFLVKYFGYSPRAWFHALEIDRHPTVQPGSPLKAAVSADLP